MMSTLFFKGQWKLPFNKTATHTEPFYDEQKNQIGEVMMMYQIGAFPYARVDSLHAHAVELSYGKVRVPQNTCYFESNNTLLTQKSNRNINAATDIDFCICDNFLYRVL